MLKAYKYLLRPTPEQASKIDRTIGVCRLLYNLGLETKIRSWQSCEINVSSFDLIKQLPELRKEYDWIKDISSRAAADSLLLIDVAFKNLYRGSGFPKFKKKTISGSFSCSGDKREIDWNNRTLTIPKIEGIPIVLSRIFEGQIRTITISRTSTGKYFASILVKSGQLQPMTKSAVNGMGIDLGISHFAILSTGRKVDNPKFLRQNLERLKLLQIRASKKVKGSKNRKKAVHRVAILHERIANKRQDFLHKLSTELIRDNQTDTICVETLSVKNMVKNHKLAQAISDVSWSEFIRQLEYKGKWYGKNIIKVYRFFASSKTCSCCGHKAYQLPLSIREWTCQCGAVHDRDINAAINIRNSGMGNPGVPVEQSALMGCDEAGSRMFGNVKYRNQQSKNIDNDKRK